MAASSFSRRAQHVLGLLVREFIHTGEPVASFMIARRTTLQVSSATIRHDLVRLEEDGYIVQPHVSAGRVPTDRGYRFYVDRLLEGRRGRSGAAAVEAELRERTGAQPLIEDVLSRVSQVLSRRSRHVGFAIAPPNAQALLHEIEFVPLSGTKILVVLVTRGGQLTRKMIEVDEPVEPDQLRQAANYLNSEFSGQPLAAVRRTLIARMQHERMLLDSLFARAMRLGRSSFEDLPDDAVMFVDGTASLLADAVHAAARVPLPTLSALLTMIEEKQRLVRLLGQYLDGPGMTVVIGAEHSTPDLRPFSLVAATCGADAELGTVGVIGPTRMRYPHAIAAVSGVALAVPRMLAAGN